MVVFTAHGDHHGVQAALDAGAHGALLKDAAGHRPRGRSAPGAARRARVDPRMVPGEAGNQAALARSGLTRREYEVLRLAAQGRTNPEIAETTGLARNTVKTYLQSALHKLGARNRVEAIGKASEAGLL